MTSSWVEAVFIFFHFEGGDWRERGIFFEINFYGTLARQEVLNIPGHRKFENTLLLEVVKNVRAIKKFNE